MSKTSPVSTQGKAFVDATGARFMVRGVALSSNTLGKDLLSNEYLGYMTGKVVPRLKELKVNTIRVYQVDVNAKHERVMDMLADQGIYVMVGVATPAIGGQPAIAINRMDPVYSYTLYKRAVGVVDMFSKHSNTLAFSVGNEVVFPGNIFPETGNDVTKTREIEQRCAAAIKSLIRDIKRYMSDKGIRPIPVGMAMQDGPQSTVPNLIGTDIVAQYYACGDAASRADYIGINSYAYVTPEHGTGNLHSYDRYATQVKDLPVPVILTESGAMNFKPGTRTPASVRDWAIVPEVYRSTLLYNNLSGQIAFQFFNKMEDLGLYREDADLTKMEYGGADNLAKAFQTAGTIPVPMPASVTDPSRCPTACHPDFLPSPAPTIRITVENYADVALKVVQNTAQLADLPAGSGNAPSSTPVKVSDNLELYVLKPGTWDLVCKVAANTLSDGATVKNNVGWGGACEVS